MNHLSVSANFRPGTVSVHEFPNSDIGPWAELAFNSPHSPSLSLHLTGLDQVAELEAALAHARAFLTAHAAAASDAA